MASTLLALVLLAPALGCRVTSDDVARWATTRNGPDKLTAVMLHKKYGTALRVDAALALVSMKPRGGRRVGIDTMVDALTQMPAELRRDALPPIVNSLASELEAAPPEKGQEDHSIPHKDAAFQLLEQPDLVTDPALRGRLETALSAWANAAFFDRLDAPAQRVGMQQLLSKLGPKSVEPLPELVTPDAPKVTDLVRIIAVVGDDQTRARAARKLITITGETASKAWLDQHLKELEKQDPEAFKKAGPEGVNKHVAGLQEDRVLQLFASFKRLGTGPGLTFLATFAQDEEQPEKLRAGALAAMEGHLKAANDELLAQLLDIARRPKTSANLRGLALLRVGEAPRERTINSLYELARSDDASVRLAAFELILGDAEQEHLAEVLRQLGEVKHLSVGEPLRYGRLVGAVEDIDVSMLDSYIAKRNAPVAIRLTALGYYYAYGTQSQIAELSRVSRDRQAVPECSEGDDDCSWRCDDQDVETVGDFFNYCVEPHMKGRDKKPPRPDRPGRMKRSDDGQAANPDDKNAADATPKASQDTKKAR